jgi:branched-chain amino acid transport system permease protein
MTRVDRRTTTAPGRTGWQALTPKRVLVAAALLVLLVFPLLAHPFFVLQIGAQTFVFGVVALSLTFLAAYGGMISLAQIALYGVSAYTVAILTLRFGAPWPLTVFAALVVATVFGAIVGLIAVRTRGIYLLMITLALSMLAFLFVRQNDTIFGGWVGFTGVQAPVVGGVWLRAPIPFYYLCLAIACAVYVMVRYVVRTPFGLTLQGIRDSDRRMRALGYNVNLHKVAAFALGGLIAGIGGVVGVWYHGGISPSSIDIARNVRILVMAVIGGIAYPIGAFLGAFVFILVDNFTTTFLHRERFNTYIGLVFLVILLVAPNGLLGIGEQVRGALRGWRGRQTAPAAPDEATSDRSPPQDRPPKPTTSSPIG